MGRKTILRLSILFCAVGISACTPCNKNSEDPLAFESRVSSKETDERAPDHQKAALANVELGLGYLSQDQVARAKSKLILALKMAPNLSEPHSAMGYFNEKVGEFKEAEQEYKKAIQLGTETKGALYNNYGAFLCRQGRYQAADQAFNQALMDKSYPRTAEVYENAGLCALKSSDPSKALIYFNASHRQNPNRTSVSPEYQSYLKSGQVSS